MASQQLSKAISRLLQQDRLLGEVMVRMPRKYLSDGQDGLSLNWHDDVLHLEIAEQKIQQISMDELVSQLAHEAYHIIWGHPIRYAHTTHPQLAAIACDMAVNEYLADPPANSWTRAEVEKISRTSFPAQAGSRVYLQQLLSLPLAKQQQLTNRLQAKANRHDNRLPVHRWINAPSGNDVKRQAQIKCLTKQAYQSSTQHQRGLLAASLNSWLAKSHDQFAFPIQAVIWRLLGQVPSGYEESRARFNRRQPWRMDLMGKISKYKSRLYVFVDNSGSMGDQDISRLLDLCQRLASRLDTALTIVSFDAAIQGPVQHLQAGQSIDLIRHGSGGTSFQVIFNWLKEQHLPMTAPVIILTDGWGETELDQFGFHNVLWLLTTNSDLSVKQVQGQVIHLRKLKS